MFYGKECPGSSNFLLDTELFLCALSMLWEASLILTTSVKASSQCLISISTVFTLFQHCTTHAHVEQHDSILPKWKYTAMVIVATCGLTALNASDKATLA